MSKGLEYKVITAGNPNSLGLIVTAYLENRWVLAGNMCAVYDPKDKQTNYMQPMMHY